MPEQNAAVMHGPCKVAVIGAGPAGLVASRELLREGHRLTVFEKADRIGGTWVYDPRTESDTLGLDPARELVHGSLYRSMRTNLPRELMGFHDYPFPGPEAGFGDPRAFPGHVEVLAFLEKFAEKSGVLDSIRFGAEVVRVEPGARVDEWVVTWTTGENRAEVVEMFEAVVVCNGHHTEPRVAEISGVDGWPGKQIHSHNYRIPEPFKDQVVVLIGMGPSAYDISREISQLAKEVHIASRSEDIELGKLRGIDNIWQHRMVKCALDNGQVVFDDGSSIHADIIFYCTGYKYRFPFLQSNEIIAVEGNRVDPLYKHVFPPRFAPWLSFVGIPNRAIIFLMLDLQSKWIARVLSGKVQLPSEKNMMESVEAYYQELESEGTKKHHTHSLLPKEGEYLNWLATEVGLPLIENWRILMYRTAIKSLKTHSETYKDTWEVEHWTNLPESTPHSSTCC